ncbi:MAG: hypothetical protein ACR2JX_00470 [Mycobacteriales bacterium]
MTNERHRGEVALVTDANKGIGRIPLLRRSTAARVVNLSSPLGFR